MRPLSQEFRRTLHETLPAHPAIRAICFTGSRVHRGNAEYILRNHLALIAIDQATQAQDYTEIDRLFKLLQNPFAGQPGMERYAEPSPDRARDIQPGCPS